ncbi:MAG TPA: glycosyltransferase family 4 protein, partial [Thermoanaerobaculia bacterium]|nr:glycosyltransferase family 4 protein [Thermoanaerobaculia bacterium]
GTTKPMHVIPCGVELPPIADEPEPGTVGFIGSLDFRPNQQAVEWILDELWPRVVARAPEARLTIAGSAPPAWLRRRVEIASDVDDAAAFMRRMSVIIAPLFAGGGMRIKVLDAMALAKPIVATPLGAGGIDVHPGRDILIAEDAGEFGEAVVRLLRDPAAATRIGNEARAMVAERYDSARLARELLTFYATL